MSIQSRVEQVMTPGPLQGIALVPAYVQGEEVLPALPRISPPGAFIILLLPLKNMLLLRAFVLSSLIFHP